MNRFLLAVSILASIQAMPTHGQTYTVYFVREPESTQHLIQHSDPIYPPIAKAAHVQGTVELNASVDESGTVTKVDVVGGPSMLRAAAADAVSHWTYKPFERDGKLTPVRVIISVPFSLGIPSAQEKSDEAIGQAYFPKADECRSANSAGRWIDAVKSCGDLLAISDRFPDSSSRANEIREAHEEYGEALAFSGNLPDAMKQFRAAIAIAEKSLTSKDAEYGTAYYWLAFAEHASHMPQDADRDYATAESAYRSAIVNLPDMKKVYDRYLAHALAYHSVLKDQTGHPDEAKTMRDEALSLDPHSLDAFKQGS
jgi:TonB family protein